MLVHPLDLTYDEYLQQGKSIADTRIDKYIVYERLDKGAFGTVYRGMNDLTKKQVAVKLVDLAAIQRDQKTPKVREIRRRLAKTESEMMNKVDSPHVMKIYDVYENKSLKIMIIEYCNGGTLSDLIYKRGRIPEAEAIQILKQVILGISAMHELNMIHRDLKSENIMCHNGLFKIVDLGFAKMLPSSSDIYVGTILGTIITMAPEVMKRTKYGVKADIWSIGVIFYQMIYGKIPYQPMKAPEMYDQIIAKDIFPNGGKVNGYKPSTQVLTLMKQILVVDQEYRLTWNELISQKIFGVSKSKLSDEYRVTVEISHLKKQKPTISKTEEQRIEQLPSIQLEPYHQGGNGVKVQKITRKQRERKQLQIDYSEKKIIDQARQYYLECLKTEFILKDIIIPIQEKNIFNIKERRPIELLYLLSSRCYCNMSNVQFQIDHQKHEVIKNLTDNVQELYQIVQAKFFHYSQELMKCENKVSSMIKDRFQKMFDSSTREIKDKFLVGNQINKDTPPQEKKAGYTKKQQIIYTSQNYIKPMITECKENNIVIRRLAEYQKINFISQKDLEKHKFYEIVDHYVKP